MSGKKVLIDGHRGNLDFVPENTMDSFRSAVELEVDAVEMDIHLSSDNALVLIHDHTVDRTTNGTGLVREKLCGELKAMGMEPWVSNVDENGFFEAVALGCTMVTHNDPAKAMKWRERL